jgi:SAM-dependent methyltransferase
MGVTKFDKDYYENGPDTGKSLYQNYRWMPELTIPLAHHIVQHCDIKPKHEILDFGCAKGYLVHALRLLGYQAYGYDISEYAIDQAPMEVQSHVNSYMPVGKYDWLIVKDVLEHIPYEEIDEVLQQLAEMSQHIFAIIPLAENGKFHINAYEQDETHYIRENLSWWFNKLNQHGFLVGATYDLGPFKKNWRSHPKGNGLFVSKLRS